MRRTLAAPTTVDAMGISHIALAVKDLEATHRFYTDVMGFDLVKVEIADMRGGKARHAFYSTGSADDQMIAFWDLRDVPGFGEGYKTDISRDLGLDPFTNHLAFQADSLDDLAAKRDRLQDAGLPVVRNRSRLDPVGLRRGPRRQRRRIRDRHRRLHRR
jgi:catechol 2,3-dioxygenase-like lactoylglutathione lyase family enzyme